MAAPFLTSGTPFAVVAFAASEAEVDAVFMVVATALALAGRGGVGGLARAVERLLRGVSVGDGSANEVQNEAAQSVTGTAVAAAPAGDAVATGTRPNAIAAVSVATRVRTRTCMDASGGATGNGGDAQRRGGGRSITVMEGRVRMAPLTWVAGAFRAQVLAARLESEGIDAQLRGSLDGAYGLTVGDMARVDVYVPEDQLVDARYVLLADEVDATLAAPTDWGDAGAETRVAPPAVVALGRGRAARRRRVRHAARHVPPLVGRIGGA